MMRTRRAIIAAVTAATLLTGTITGVLFTPAIASAQIVNAEVPFHISPAADSSRYVEELGVMDNVFRMRQLYYQAALREDSREIQKSGPQAEQNIQKMKSAADYASLRLVIAILKMEGDPDARTIDVEKVGLDKQATLDAIKKISVKVGTDVFFLGEYLATGELKPAEIQRLHVFTRAADYMKLVSERLNAGDESVLENSPYSVVDYGVLDWIVEWVQEENFMPSRFNQVEVLHVGSNGQVDPAAEIRNGEQNHRLFATNPEFQWHPDRKYPEYS